MWKPNPSQEQPDCTYSSHRHYWSKARSKHALKRPPQAECREWVKQCAINQSNPNPKWDRSRSQCLCSLSVPSKEEPCNRVEGIFKILRLGRFGPSQKKPPISPAQRCLFLCFVVSSSCVSSSLLLSSSLPLFLDTLKPQSGPHDKVIGRSYNIQTKPSRSNLIQVHVPCSREWCGPQVVQEHSAAMASALGPAQPREGRPMHIALFLIPSTFPISLFPASLPFRSLFNCLSPSLSESFAFLALCQGSLAIRVSKTRTLLHCNVISPCLPHRHASTGRG